MKPPALLLLLLVALPLATAQKSDVGDRKRFPILVDMMTHEIGFCYQAHLDFGEEGDRDTRNASGIRVLENGKELGPRAALHADIRAKGQGRYSHWVRQTLYFSASDNSDPRTNGRTYEVVSLNPASALGGLKEIGGEPKKHVEVVTSSDHEYAITLGGTLDMDNTMTRSHGGITVAFQPNLSLTIENTGKSPVLWPRLIANGRGNWGTLDSLVNEFCQGAETDQERALFIWQAARENRYHCLPLFADDEFHDPVKMFKRSQFQEVSPVDLS